MFLHELGHGISAYLQKKPVSTGFNRVGDIYKRPSDSDFREEIAKWNFTWDLGVPITLGLAILFSILCSIASNTSVVFLFGGLAFANILLRLVPMLISFFYLLFKGNLLLEDEVGIGMDWYKKTKIKALKYLPPAISFVVSLICLVVTVAQLTNKLPDLTSDAWFVPTNIVVFTAAIFTLNYLDEHVRINWKV